MVLLLLLLLLLTACPAGLRARRSARARTPKVIVDAPSKGGPGVAAPAPSAEELKLREELESLKRENAKLKAPALCAEDASLLDALL